MTDSEFMLSLLEDRPCTTMEIIRESIQRRGVGCTPHSRAADLRRQGHDIRCERAGEIRGRAVYVYEWIQKPIQLELAS